MRAPNLQRMIETFVLIDSPAGAAAQDVWQGYAELLRSKISPLVRNRMKAGKITWYGFLVHDKASGVPTTDEQMYVHLRMCLAKGVDPALFMKRLPSFCKFTRKMHPPNPQSLDTCDVRFFKKGRVEQGWKILGDSSAWALDLLDAHDPKKPVPIQNVAQLLHYLGNQLLVSVVEIPMP